MPLDYNFDVQYDQRRWLGKCSVAQLAQALVNFLNRLSDKGEARSEMETQLYDAARKHVGFLKLLHQTTYDFAEVGDENFRVLSDLFYGSPRKPEEFDHWRSQMGRPHLRGLTAGLLHRLDFLNERYEMRLYRGRSWGWFIDLIGTLGQLFQKAKALDADVAAVFALHQKVKKVEDEEEKTDDADADSKSDEAGVSVAATDGGENAPDAVVADDAEVADVPPVVKEVEKEDDEVNGTGTLADADATESLDDEKKVDAAPTEKSASSSA